MRISIIGTNGFLSTAIAQSFFDKGWRVDMYGLEKPERNPYHAFYSVNLLQAEPNYAELAKSNIVIYASGAGIQSNLHETATLVYSLNVTTPVTICNSLKEHNYRGVVVTFGSYFELGKTDNQCPATEWDIINASASAPFDYVVSKRMLTRFVTSYQHDFTHWHFVLPTIYGPNENSERLIPYTINAIRQNKELQFTSGDQIRQYLFVGEVAMVLDIAFSKSLSSGVYNIAGSETLTIRDIVIGIYDCYHKKVPYGCFGKMVKSDVDMKYLALDGSALKNAIDFSAQILLSQTIKNY